MNKCVNRWLSVLLALTMLVSVMPVGAMAAAVGPAVQPGDQGYVTVEDPVTADPLPVEEIEVDKTATALDKDLKTDVTLTIKPKAEGPIDVLLVVDTSQMMKETTAPDFFQWYIDFYFADTAKKISMMPKW